MAFTHCSMCNRITHHLLNTCTEHSEWPLNKVYASGKYLSESVHFERTSSAKKDVPVIVAKMVSEPANQFRSRKVIKTSSSTTTHRCVGCHQEVSPGLCYTGSVLGGLVFKTLPGSITRTPIEVIHEWPSPFFEVTGGGEVIQEEKKIGFYKRIKGLICETCAGNYNTIEDKRGVKHPLVITNERPGYIGSTARGAEEARRGRSRRIPFNTRYTQGRRGKRV